MKKQQQKKCKMQSKLKTFDKKLNYKQLDLKKLSMFKKIFFYFYKHLKNNSKLIWKRQQFLTRVFFMKTLCQVRSSKLVQQTIAFGSFEKGLLQLT